MKTSNYLVTAFLVFFLGIILAMQIDSKLYEPTEKIRRKIERNYKSVLRLKRISKDKKITSKDWKQFIKTADSLTTKETVFPKEIVGQALVVYNNYDKFKDVDALKKVISWCKMAYEKEPNYPKLNRVYADVLFQLGDTEKAIFHMKIALKKGSKPKSKKYYKKRLKIFNETRDLQNKI